MTFYTYMMRNKDSVAQPLVKRIKDEKTTFPRNGDGKYVAWHEIIKAYLQGKGMHMEVFEKYWSAYVAGEKARKIGYARKGY